MKRTVYAVFLALLLTPTLALGQSQPQSKPVPKITAEEATKIALQRIPGKVTSVVMERKLGKNVYTVEIQTPQGEKDVLVDVETGRIVGTE